MPAAAVIQRPQALSGFIGRKASVGGLNFFGKTKNFKSDVKSRSSTPKPHRILTDWRSGGAYRTYGVGVKSVDIIGNTKGEGIMLACI